ncbi:MAG TPA: 2,3-bisphosphoglycerate-independent phosphoglycerate mutase [Planctomycetota bacterium]|jgi:2,3-bisphosphoglycerate-independent phosphoglycerate mutase|nr:2,3-bisphosphoglycerate-independent phosphoglycerate mutase [Planctomycetota bacterium]
MSRPPAVLAILDGWGERAEREANAIALAPAARIGRLREAYPCTLLAAHGREVGLPEGLIGNSEVGHLNLGAGRVVWQPITRIDLAIEKGKFFENRVFLDAVEAARRSGGAVHLLGLVSDGGVHSVDRHYFALLELLARRAFPGDRVFFHAVLDGRDTLPRSAEGYLAALERAIARAGVGRIATVLGRYYAMDRDQRWDRTRRAYEALTRGAGFGAASAAEALAGAYARGETDEFVQPTVVGGPAAGRVRDGDAVLFFNFRPDRMRQIVRAFFEEKFEGFERAVAPRPILAAMTQYREEFPVPVAFPPTYLRGVLGEVFAGLGGKQLRIAETEKYAHVTYFFNGGDERTFPGEERVLVPSPKVATYDQAPEMSAREVTSRLLGAIEAGAHDAFVVNYANPDMVGHTGVLPAAIEAVRVVDACVGAVAEEVLRRGGVLAITSDHGNCEVMVDPATGSPHTAHTTNPVPFLLVSPAARGARLEGGGRLADVAPTLLDFLGLPAPREMEGRSLLRRAG